jgi:translation initiation factor 2 subunit 2
MSQSKSSEPNPIIINLNPGVNRVSVSTEKEYLSLLDRLYSKVPERAKKQGIQALPELVVYNIGNTTIVKNFGEYCDRLRRDVKTCTKYLLKELAAPGTAEGNGQLVIQGKFSSQVINTLMERFIHSYVQCMTCKSIDTVLKMDKKVWYISCLACGAQTPIKPL